MYTCVWQLNAVNIIKISHQHFPIQAAPCVWHNNGLSPLTTIVCKAALIIFDRTGNGLFPVRNITRSCIVAFCPIFFSREIGHKTSCAQTAWSNSNTSSRNVKTILCIFQSLDIKNNSASAIKVLQKIIIKDRINPYIITISDILFAIK